MTTENKAKYVIDALHTIANFRDSVVAIINERTSFNISPENFMLSDIPHILESIPPHTQSGGGEEDGGEEEPTLETR